MNTEKRIIFPKDLGGIQLISPAPSYNGSMEDLAQRVVPEGKPWRIVDLADFPSEERINLNIDFSNPTSSLYVDPILVEQNKPILSGQELNKKLRSLFKHRTVAERKALLTPVLVELDILKEDDEVTQAEYDDLKQALILGIGDNLTTEEISLIEAELDSFVSFYKL